MSNRKIQSKLDSPNLGGRVEVKLKDAETGRVKQISIGNNNLSKANKVRVAFLAGQYLNDQANSPMGKTLITGADGITLSNSDNRYHAANNDKQRNIVLLNLGDTANTDEFISIYEADGSLNTADVVRGWFNSCDTKSGNPYLGVYTPNSPIQSIKKKMSMSEVRGFFDMNKAIGHITHVAVMPGLGSPITMAPNYNGFAAWQCLASSYTNSFMIPCGINGLTGDNEILVYSPSSDGDFYKINLNTGIKEISTRLISDITGNINIKCFKKIDDNRIAFSDIYDAVYIYEYDSAGQYTKKYYRSQSTIYGIFELADDPDNIYFTDYYDYNSYFRYLKVNKSTYATEELTGSDAEALVGGLPTKWVGQESKVAIIGSSGQKYYILNKETKEIIVATNPKDICSSMVGTLTYPGAGFSLFDTANTNGIMYMCNPQNIQDTIIGKLCVKTNVAKPEEETEISSVINYNMPWISYGYYSNWYNLYKLSSPIDKTETDTIDVSYGIGYRE